MEIKKKRRPAKKSTSTKKAPTKKRLTVEEDDELPTRKIGDIKRNRSWALYGRSGSGKTTLAATFPKPILYLDIRDEGTDSIADVEGIDVLEPKTVEEVEEALFWLIRNPKRYKTVIIDTVTQMQEMAVEEIAAKSKSKKKAGEWGSMTKQMWGEVSAKLKSLIIDFRNLPMEVVFIAQDRVFNLDDEDGEDSELMPEVGPRLMPSVASVLNAAVTVIGNTFIRQVTVKKKVKGVMKRTEKTEYCLRVGPSHVYVTKIRKPRSLEAPEFISDPTYEAIVDVIKGE